MPGGEAINAMNLLPLSAT